MSFKRVLLKLSGESLTGENSYGISINGLENIAAEIKKALKSSVQVAVVIGGGNIWRGAGKEIDRVTADHMGMLATIINALALKDILEKNEIKAKVQSAVDVAKFCEFYGKEKAISYLKKGHVLILAGGTGNPYFTTDTTAALRAAELEADILLKATQVDGVYDSDPKKNKDAKKYDSLTYDEALSKNLKVMDAAAFSICKENSIPILVFDFYKKGNLEKAVSGSKVGTFVK